MSVRVGDEVYLLDGTKGTIVAWRKGWFWKKYLVRYVKRELAYMDFRYEDNVYFKWKYDDELGKVNDDD